ncbi:MAG: stage II sporulation protein M [Vulcanimicrobiaceae bacterium]
MRERRFVDGRQAGWLRLEALLDRADRSGLRGFDRAEVRELASLYRATCADLAAAQSRAYDGALVAYVNRLTARAYVVVYGATATAGWTHVARFFAATFPREIRRAGGIIAATSGLFALAAIVSYALVITRPEYAYALVPAEQVPAITQRLHDANFGFDRAFAPAMSSLIIANNIKVAMLAFAGGMTLGVLTLWEIVGNGLMVGSLGALFTRRGFGSDFWATIAPHGVIELTSIQIASAAGLLLAQAIVAPGRARRIDALRANARRAGVLVIGVAGLLVVAGAIEGFVTPQRTSEAVRFALGASTAVALFAYIACAGRRDRQDGGDGASSAPIPFTTGRGL